MSAKPYIGVTGYGYPGDVKLVAERCEFPVGYYMFGFTSSDKRLRDPASSGKTSPSLDQLGELVSSVPPHHLPMIHYFTKTPNTLLEEILALYDYCKLDSGRCGLQLNLHWPDPQQILSLCKSLPGLVITLQLPKQALELSDTEIVKKLQGYCGSIKYALIDPSGGLGQDFDLERAARLLLAIQKGTDITPGVAGGFSADNVADRIHKLQRLAICDSCERSGLEDFCIDAQGRLRTEEVKQPVFPKDAAPTKYSNLSTIETVKYITSALDAFCG